ncbi:MAG: virulence RhuM family protein [Bacteroidales bacterium]|nr:virulence RhuM family protein [Bacteroidales bacterium]
MKNKKHTNTENGELQEIVIYQTDDGAVQIDVLMGNETVWLSTSQMTMLFEREESNIRRHIINIFKEGELPKENNVHFLHVNGIKKPVPFYSLDVIISVGYRVKSLRGTQFRIWATKRLNETNNEHV